MSDERRRRIEETVQRCYSTWGPNYYKEYYEAGAPYPPVHAELIRGLLLEAGARNVIDAGCGPASFLRRLAKDGMDLYGFDLTEEMVAEGKRVFTETGLDPKHLWQGSVLDPTAYDGPLTPNSANFYDAAVCIGVIPHIPAEEDAQLLANLHRAVRPGGLVVLEARNQLFSLFTQNRPSYEFIRDELIRANRLLERAGEKRADVQRALETFQSHFRMDLPPVRRGKAGEPGYDEVLSRAHNPLLLPRQFESCGFDDVRVLFYHYHAMPPLLSADFAQFFLQESVAMEDPQDWRGYFMASAFLIVGTKR